MTAVEALGKIRVMLGLEEVEGTTSLETETATIDIELAEATLVDGTEVYTEGALEVGNRLLIKTPEGEESPYAPSAIHETTDGLLIGVGEDGEIMEISEVAPEEEVVDEVVVETKENFNEDFINKLVGVLKPSFDKIDEMSNEIKTLKGEFSEFKDEPAGKKVFNNLNDYQKREADLMGGRVAKLVELRNNKKR